MQVKDFIEIKVAVKDDEQKLVKKFPVYNKIINLSHDDPVLKGLVDQVVDDFQGEKTSMDVVVTVNYTW